MARPLSRLLGARSFTASTRTITSASSGPSTAMSVIQKAFANRTFESHDELYKFSIEKPDEFWGGIARSQLNWFKDFDTVMECDMREAKFTWFKGGKLNAAVNCVDRHAADNPDRVALIWEKDEPGQQEYITYKDLSSMVNRIANLLLRNGVTRGAVVSI